jgi:hypothetical protein
VADWGLQANIPPEFMPFILYALIVDGELSLFSPTP